MTATKLDPAKVFAPHVPPNNLDAEQSVLGAAMSNAAALNEVTSIIAPQDFYRSAHRLIAETIWTLHSRKRPVDAVTVLHELQRRGLVKQDTGPYLHTLLASVPTVANADYYARIVKEHAEARKLIDACTRCVQALYDGADPVEARRLLAEEAR